MKKKFFDNLADTWDEELQHDKGRILEIISYLEISNNCNILDAGCGTGVFTHHLIEKFKDNISVTCLDFSPKMLEVARKKFNGLKNVSFLCNEITKTGLPEKSFDRIICYSCFPHILNKLDALNIFKSLLKQGGILVIAHSANYNEINRFHANCDEPVKGDFLPCPYEMKSLMQNAEFTDIEIIDKPHLYVIKGWIK